MITVELARALLRESGVLWEPAAGDRFVIDAELLSEEVFWISDLTVEVQRYRDHSLLGFNGTTEWALDSVTLDQALWLPREDQLRELLGDRLESVRRTEAGWEVTYAVAHLALGLDGAALLAVVVCSSLPTAQNIFVHATRYDRSSTLARDTILVTTVGAVPLITLVVWLLG